MKNNFEELLNAVETINDELSEKYLAAGNADDLPILSATKGGYYIVSNISIPNGPEIHLYNSEEDDRKYDEDTNSYESYYDCLKRKFREFKELINNIEL